MPFVGCIASLFVLFCIGHDLKQKQIIYLTLHKKSNSKYKFLLQVVGSYECCSKDLYALPKLATSYVSLLQGLMQEID
jgi:hypothetical protein